MAVRMFYVDESYDANKFCLTAIGIRHRDWREVFRLVREHRALLKEEHGIYVRKEIHARDFVSGRGKIADKDIGKWQRSRIYHGLLQLIARLPGVMLFNVCLDVAAHEDAELAAWDRLLNRIERTMKQIETVQIPQRRALVEKARGAFGDEAAKEFEGPLMRFAMRALVFADQGREREITRIMRKMGVFNPVPSQHGGWSGGKATKNIPLERIIEDPIFKPSHQSFLIQLADCAAYALLKRETLPTPLVKKYGLDEMFEDALAPVCFRAASPRDALGIVRN
jgi:hypothetical protein